MLAAPVPTPGLSCSLHSAACPGWLRGGLARVSAVPPRWSRWRGGRLPGSWVALVACHGLDPLWSSPVGPRGQASTAARCCLPPPERRRLPQVNFRGSIPRPAHSLSTLHVDGRPATRKTRFRQVASLRRAGSACGAPSEVSWPSHLPPRPGFAGRTQVSSIAIWDVDRQRIVPVSILQPRGSRTRHRDLGVPPKARNGK